jgi:hypothetical protein
MRKNKYQMKKSAKLCCFTHAWAGLIQPIAVKVCTVFQVTIDINLANFGGGVLRFLACAKGRIYAFPLEADMALRTVFPTALACGA